MVKQFKVVLAEAPMYKTLVLDANQRSALATTRSLGRRGIHVIAGDEARYTLAGVSHYCAERLVYPSPYATPQLFAEVLGVEIRRRGVQILLPMSEVTTSIVLASRSRLGEVRIPYANDNAFNVLSDKIKLLDIAAQLGVPAPRSRVVHDPTEAPALAAELGYPVVIKPGRSRILAGQHWLATSVRYAGSRENLERIVAADPVLQRHPFLLQEFISGIGQGVFTLYHAGQPVVFFAHRRIREKPPSGGVSVLSESCSPEPMLVEYSKCLLNYVAWDGVAMVEYKVDRDGKPFLMEVNARFWGSLQLSIDAGIDFPFLAYLAATGATPLHSGSYRTGIRSRWLLGDLDHLYLRIKHSRNQAGPQGRLWRAVLGFLNFWSRDTQFEVNRWDDPMPFLYELAAYLGLIRLLPARFGPRPAE